MADPDAVLDAALLTEIGVALYGRRWVNAMAADINVNKKTLRRWSNGVSPISAELDHKVMALLEQRRIQLLFVSAKLRRRIFGKLDTGPAEA